MGTHQDIIANIANGSLSPWDIWNPTEIHLARISNESGWQVDLWTNGEIDKSLNTLTYQVFDNGPFALSLPGGDITDDSEYFDGWFEENEEGILVDSEGSIWDYDEARKYSVKNGDWENYYEYWAIELKEQAQEIIEYNDWE